MIYMRICSIENKTCLYVWRYIWPWFYIIADIIFVLITDIFTLTSANGVACAADIIIMFDEYGIGSSRTAIVIIDIETKAVANDRPYFWFIKSTGMMKWLLIKMSDNFEKSVSNLWIHLCLWCPVLMHSTKCNTRIQNEIIFQFWARTHNSIIIFFLSYLICAFINSSLD